MSWGTVETACEGRARRPHTEDRTGLQALPRVQPFASSSECVAVQLERAGHRVLSEREIEARERAEGRRVFSVQRRSSHFRPDLVVLGDPPEAVEVELTDKSARRLDEILRAWRRSLARGQFGRVSYLCSPRALPYVRRASERLGNEWAVEIEPLSGRIAAAGPTVQPCP